MIKRILCFGDSNTFGYDSKTLGRFDESTRWTRRLAQILGNSYTVIEEGLNGRTAGFDDPFEPDRNGRKQISACLQKHQPLDLLVLMIGTNDLKQHFDATASDVASSFRQLIQLAKNESVWNGLHNVLLFVPIIIQKQYINGIFYKGLGDGCHEKSLQLVNHLKIVAIYRSMRLWTVIHL